MKISEKGKKMQKRFRAMRYISLLIYLLAAGSFVFYRNIPVMLVLVAINIFMEVKFYRCPHCNKGLDCRRHTGDETRCPKCDKLLFKEYNDELKK